jgi:hypothetical protein
MSSLPIFEKRAENPIYYRIGSSAINSPTGHNLKDDYINSIINRLMTG